MKIYNLNQSLNIRKNTENTNFKKHNFSANLKKNKSVNFGVSVADSLTTLSSKLTIPSATLSGLNDSKNFQCFCSKIDTFERLLRIFPKLVLTAISDEPEAQKIIADYKAENLREYIIPRDYEVVPLLFKKHGQIIERTKELLSGAILPEFLYRMTNAVSIAQQKNASSGLICDMERGIYKRFQDVGNNLKTFKSSKEDLTGSSQQVGDYELTSEMLSKFLEGGGVPEFKKFIQDCILDGKYIPKPLIDLFKGQTDKSFVQNLRTLWNIAAKSHDGEFMPEVMRDMLWPMTSHITYKHDIIKQLIKGVDASNMPASAKETALEEITRIAEEFFSPPNKKIDKRTGLSRENWAYDPRVFERENIDGSTGSIYIKHEIPPNIDKLELGEICEGPDGKYLKIYSTDGSWDIWGTRVKKGETKGWGFKTKLDSEDYIAEVPETEAEALHSKFKTAYGAAEKILEAEKPKQRRK